MVIQMTEDPTSARTHSVLTCDIPLILKMDIYNCHLTFYFYKACFFVSYLIW